MWVPWGRYSIENGNGGRNIDGDELVNANFRNQYTRWNDHTVEEEGDNVRDYLPHEEESINHMKLLPY